MKAYFFLIIPILALCSCQHYTKTELPVTGLNGNWTFQKDTVSVYWGYTRMKYYINDIGARSTLTFDLHSELGSATYTGTPDTSLVFYYYPDPVNPTVQIIYPSQLSLGVVRPEQIYNYTIVQATDHVLELNYAQFFTDPLGTSGEIYGNYYWTK